jgi:hypothetical protein
MPRPFLRFAALVSFAAVNLGSLSLLAQDEPDAEPQAQTFIGKLEGAPASARLAVVVHEKCIVGYVCSTDEEFNQKHAAWCQGELDAEGRLQASGSKGRLTGQRKEDQLTLELAGSDGTKFTATASLAPPDSVAGLYRDVSLIKGEAWVSGWIIDDSGQVCGQSGQRQGKGKSRTLSAKLKGKKQRNVQQALGQVVNGAQLIPNQVLAAQVQALQAQVEVGNQQGIDVQDVQADALAIQAIANEAQADIEEGEIALVPANQAAMLQSMKNMAARAALIRQSLAGGASKKALLQQASALDGAIDNLAKRAGVLKNKKLNAAIQAMAQRAEELVAEVD